VSNDILPNEQFSFHENISTENAIFRLVSIFSVWNNQEYIVGLFCYLTKASDSFSHELLVLRSEFYGVKGFTLNWQKSYLHNRKQRVELQFVSSPNLPSDWETVEMGFLRGVLGPLLYCMVWIQGSKINCTSISTEGYLLFIW
jgi:hypothetical protein